jgi:hypothetical protein
MFLRMLIAGVFCLGFSTLASAQDKQTERVLRHVVLFKFKETSTPESIAKIEQSFRELPGQIEQIVDFEWGTNNSTEGLDHGYTHCFFLTFADESGRAAYLPHPAHKAFVAVLKPELEEVTVIDYWVQD